MATGDQLPSTPRLPGLDQVGVVVRDLDRAIADFSTIFGLGPWDTFATRTPVAPGRPGYFTARISLAQHGPVQIELIEPQEGTSIYHDHLAVKGEGLHHLCFLVQDFDERMAAMKDQGMVVLSSGRLGAGGAFAYLEGSKSAGVIIEFVKPNPALQARFDSLKQSAVTERAGLSSHLALPPVDQVCIVVGDLDPTIADLSSIGIGPWDIMPNRPASQPIVRGKPETTRVHIAHAQLGPVQLEVLQPIEGNSIHREHLDTKGEGLHHLGFVVKDFEERVAAMKEQGIGVLQGGPIGTDSAYAYMDTNKTAGIICEFVKANSYILEMYERVRNLSK